jgi:hypothetical protein
LGGLNQLHSICAAIHPQALEIATTERSAILKLVKFDRHSNSITEASMAELTFENICKSCEYKGPFERLVNLSRGWSGNWEERGDAKVFTDSDADVFWWPDTSDVLVANYGGSWDQEIEDLEWVEDRYLVSPGGGASRWKTSAHRKLGKLSLPELVFREPVAFFNLVQKAEAGAAIFDDGELSEVWTKICAIRLPDNVAPGSRVMHKYSSPPAVYEGFTLSSKPVESVRQRGMVFIDSHIDLRKGVMKSRIRPKEQTSIPSLLRVLEPNGISVWDRQKCEAFFDDDSNFMWHDAKALIDAAAPSFIAEQQKAMAAQVIPWPSKR